MKATTEKRLMDIGLLVLRVGIGLMFIGHGWPKVTGGPDAWKGLAGGVFGSDAPGFLLAAMGLLAGLAEAGGGLLLVLGLFFRPAALIMLLNMFGAIRFHIGQGHGLMKMSHAVEAAILFLALVIMGPGRFALDRLVCRSGRSQGKAKEDDAPGTGEEAQPELPTGE